MSDDAPRKPTGYTHAMREARAARLSATNHQPQESVAAMQPNIEQPSPAVPEATPITRENRRPFGSTSQKLAYPQRLGYFHYWFNDNPGRLDGALEAGYKHVLYDKGPNLGKNVERVVGVREGGSPIVAFLMEIPLEWRTDDMREYEKKNEDVDTAIRRGVVGMDKANPKDAGKFYPTAQGREISLQRR